MLKKVTSKKACKPRYIRDVYSRAVAVRLPLKQGLKLYKLALAQICYVWCSSKTSIKTRIETYYFS